MNACTAVLMRTTSISGRCVGVDEQDSTGTTDRAAVIAGAPNSDGNHEQASPPGYPASLLG